MTGSNRPLIKYREKHKYANIVFELERTGHGFNATAIDALDEIRLNYSEKMANTEEYQTEASLTISLTPRTVTLEGILPDDRIDIIESCWNVVSDPEFWFPLGWPQQGYHPSLVKTHTSVA